MVTQRREYRFVDIPSGIKIDGSVMPKRGNKDLILGEDPCFIQEAFAEREYVRSGCIGAPTFEMNKNIVGERYRNVIDKYMDWVGLPYRDSGKPLDPLWVPKRDYYAGSEYSTMSPCQLDQDARLILSEFKGNSNMFKRGSPVKSQPIMDVYDDLKLLRHFQIKIPQDELLTNCTYSRSLEGSFNVERSIQPPYIWRWYSDERSTDNGKVWAAETKMLDTGSFHFKTESDFPDWVDETQVWVLLYFNWRTHDSPQGDWSNHYRSVLCPINGTRYYDGFTIPIDGLMSRFREQRDNLPCIYNPLNYNGGTYWAECSIHADWLTTKLGTHTKWWA